MVKELIFCNKPLRLAPISPLSKGDEKRDRNNVFLVAPERGDVNEVDRGVLN